MPRPTRAKLAEMLRTGPIRLECSGGCGAQLDGIKRVPKGWTGVYRRRSLTESLTTYDGPDDPPEPPGYSACDWETHAGLCPACTREDK